MDNEFKKIMSFFSLDQSQKAEHLDEVFENSVHFFEKFKQILESGTTDEKEAIMNQVVELQKKLQQETERMCHETGLSESELKDFAQDKENFSEQEWNSIQSARQKLEKQADSLSEILPPKNKEEREGEKKTSIAPKKKKWMKS